jgi:hypothetical protein
MIPTARPQQALWLDFHRALARRNFVRAVDLARQLGIDEERIRRIQRDALKQFIAEYQNFDAAAGLHADYRITAEEFDALINEILERKELESQRTFTMRSGKPAHVSVAEQTRDFARRQTELLNKGGRRSAPERFWKRLVTALKSWLDRMSNPWQGGFPHGGLSYG